MTDRLYELAYISSSVQTMKEAELNAMLEAARNNNHNQALTGMLLYADNTFLQVLEGEQRQVEHLFEKIRTDPRHIHVMLIHQGPIDRRHFPDWKMGYRRLQSGDFERKVGFTDLLRDGSPAGEAFRHNPNTSHKLLHSFSQCSSIIPCVD